MADVVVEASTDDDAKMQCMKLIAEMELLDQESERLNAIMELEQLKTALVAMSEVSADDAALASVRTALAAEEDDDAEPPSPESVIALSSPPHSPSSAMPSSAVERSLRQSTLSEADQARLARLLADDDNEPVNPYAQTSTLRMINQQRSEQEPQHGGGGALPALAAQVLSAAEQEFTPDASAMEGEIARMEAELRELTLRRDLQAQKLELSKLTALLEEAEAAGQQHQQPDDLAGLDE